MMRKIIIIFCICLFSRYSFSQVLPQHFIFSKGINISLPNPVKDNVNNFISRMLAVPNSSPTIISNFISDILVKGDTIWFGTGKGISRTADNGITFQNYYDLKPFGTDDVSGLAVYKNYVAVATAVSQTINGNSVPTGTGIKVSSDYGVTWSAYPQPVDDRGDSILVYGANNIYALAITVPQQNLSYDVLITKKNTTSDSVVIWITSWAGELRKSTDNGATFKRVLLPPDDLDSIYPGGTYNFQYNPRDVSPGNDNHKCFSITSTNDSTIFVGTAGGINRSTDWGVSWRKFAFNNTGSGSGISGNFVVGLQVQKYSNKQIVWGATNAGAQRTGNGQFNAVSFSTDGGNTWANTLQDDAVFSHNMGFKDSIVFIATDNGIWRSEFTPPNFSWSKPSLIYDETSRDKVTTSLFYSMGSKGDSLWIGSGDGLCRISETGAPWTGKWKIFRAYQNLTSTNETYAAPNPFSPDDELLRIFFKTGKTQSDVTIKIFDFGMNPVRTVIQNATRKDAGVLFVIWDGKTDDGRQVANGVYFYRIEIDKDQTVWGKILVLQ